MLQITLNAKIRDTIVDAWLNGLDTIECEGYLFGMFEDGIWLIHSCTVVMNDASKVQFMGLPSVAWGSNS